MDKTRLSINGWFHGPPVPRQSPHSEKSPEFLYPLELPVNICT